MTLYTVITGKLETYERDFRKICHYSNYAEAKKAFKEACALVVDSAKEYFMPFQISPRKGTLEYVTSSAHYAANVNYTFLSIFSQETVEESEDDSAYLVYYAALMKAEI